VANCLIVDCNFAGLRLLRRLLNRGHRITFLRSQTPELSFSIDESAKRIFAAVHCTYDLPATLDRDAVLSLVAKAHAEEPIDAVFCVHEGWIEIAAACAELVGAPFTSTPSVSIARRKDRMRGIVASAGVPSARCRATGSLEEILDLAGRTPGPFVIKPVSGALSQMVRVVRKGEDPSRSKADLIAERERLPTRFRELVDRGFMIEDYLEGRLLSVEIGRRGREYFEFMVSERIRAADNEAIELGSIMPARISRAQRAACFAYVRQVIEAIGLDRGIFHIEIILTEEGPRLVEANPRLMGGTMPFLYDFAAENSIHEALIDLTLGNPIAVPEIARGRAAASFTLKTTGSGTVSASFDPVPPPEFVGVLARSDFYVKPGQRIDGPTVLGRLQVLTVDSCDIRRRILGIADYFAERLGVATIRPEDVTRG